MTSWKMAVIKVVLWLTRVAVNDFIEHHNRKLGCSNEEEQVERL
jgi:hypothetical protein